MHIFPLYKALHRLQVLCPARIEVMGRDEKVWRGYALSYGC